MIGLISLSKSLFGFVRENDIKDPLVYREYQMRQYSPCESWMTKEENYDVNEYNKLIDKQKNGEKLTDREEKKMTLIRKYSNENSRYTDKPVPDKNDPRFKVNDITEDEYNSRFDKTQNGYMLSGREKLQMWNFWEKRHKLDIKNASNQETRIMRDVDMWLKCPDIYCDVSGMHYICWNCGYRHMEGRFQQFFAISNPFSRNNPLHQPFKPYASY